MKRVILIAVFAFLTLLSLFSYVYSIVTSSPLGQFNVTIQNDTSVTQLVLNYTNSYQGNITISTNSSYGSLSLEFLNSSTYSYDSFLKQNYTQGNIITGCQNMPIMLQHNNASYVAELLDLTSSASKNFTLIVQPSSLICLPGAYVTTKFTVRNKTQTSETANITVRLDIPISSLNTLSTQTGTANFTGALPPNATTYHSFFFNATYGAGAEVANMTGFAINVTASSDVDIFVLNNAGVLKAKSINKSAKSEWLIFNKHDEFSVTPNEWEIRVYGNNTTSSITYTGYVIFTTLNITNSSGQTPIDFNFGTMYAPSNTSFNLTLNNSGSINLTGITETKEIYYIKTFGNGSATPFNFSLFLPDSGIINKVKATLNWTGDANYTLNVYFPNGNLAGTSSNKYIFANASGVMKEEYNETSSIPTAAGIWKFEVVNNTVAASTFNVTVYAYYPASNWIASNLTTLTLNTNTTSNITVNFTVPSTAMSGTHEGYIQYLDNRKGGIRIPLKVNVTTPMLVVNDTFSSMTYQRNENYGVNLSIFNTYFNISNPGDYDLNITYTNSENMSCYSGNCTGYNATFFFNNTTSYIPARNFFMLNVTMIMNSSLPAETAYSGWIRINGTNNTDPNMTAHPYPDFLITLRLNVTKYLKLIITDVKSADGIDNVALGNTSLINNAENVTVKFYVQTINGTNSITGLTTSNITAAWLQEGNNTNTTGRILPSGNASFYIGENPWFDGSYYNLNMTIPAYQPGGRYYPMIIMFDYNNSQTYAYNITTTNPSNNVVVVNNSGYLMSTNISDSDSACYFGSSCETPTITVNNGSTTSVFVNISNYGPLSNTTTGAGVRTFYSSCTGWTVSNATSAYYNCPYNGSSTTFNATGYSTTCMARFDVTSPATAGTCTIYFSGTPSYNWFNTQGINITFSSSVATTTTTTTASASSSSSSSTSSVAANYLDITTYPSLIIVTQGSTNSTLIKVKNTNTTYTQLIKLTVDNLNSSWYSVSPSTSQSVAALATVNFTVTFSPAADAEIKDYAPSFKAVSDYSSISKSFTFRVTPTETTKTQINSSLDQLKANATALESELNSLKALYNMSAAEAKLNQLKAKINESEAFIKAGDYNSAYALFTTIKSLMNDVRTEIENAKKQSFFIPSNIVTYVLIGGGAAAAVVLAYLFWPTKAPALGRAAVTEGAGIAFGRTKEAGSSAAERLREILSKIKSRFSRKKTDTQLKT